MVREPTQGLSKNKRLQKEFAMGGLHDSPGRSESLRLKSQGMAPLERGEPFLFRDKARTRDGRLPRAPIRKYRYFRINANCWVKRMILKYSEA